jgi:hypothetical protein
LAYARQMAELADAAKEAKRRKALAAERCGGGGGGGGLAGAAATEQRAPTPSGLEPTSAAVVGLSGVERLSSEEELEAAARLAPGTYGIFLLALHQTIDGKIDVNVYEDVLRRELGACARAPCAPMPLAPSGHVLAPVLCACACALCACACALCTRVHAP